MTAAYAERIDYLNARSSLRAIEDRLLRQRDALLQLTAAQPVDCDALPVALKSILEVSAAALAVNRASIWRYNDDRSAIVCVDLYTAGQGGHDAGARLSAVNFPRYFAAIAESEVVAIEDAEHDPRTAAFADSYLRPFGIRSMMDVPLHLKGDTIGVVCYEQVSEPRAWTTDERAFAIAISNLVSLAFERCERARAESTLALQAAALNAAANAMVITDRNAVVAWVNPAFVDLTGYSADESIGRNIVELLRTGAHDQQFFDEMWETLLAGKVWQGEFSNRKKDGTIFVVDQTITPVRDAAGRITHFVSIKRDLTSQRELEAEYRQAQKMEVVGRLAGGVAHDFNNMLTVINGTAELAMLELSPNHPLNEDLGRILDSGKRAAALTRQLLMFSRRQLTQRQPIEMQGVLENLRTMLQRLIGEDIRLEVAVASDAGSILADQSQFEQVILNLVVNARDAMPTGGTVRIEATAVELHKSLPALKAPAPGRFVKLTVADNGTGMPPEIVAKIFEPFFTTKESGKGTGLGLATVYAIVEQSGGTIEVDSAPSRGTTFSVYLPQVPGGGVVAEAAPPQQRDGTESILLVEDDADVREIARRSLQRAGYRVLTAGDAATAIDLLDHAQQPVSLLVTDVVMPGHGGREVAAMALSRHPEIRVLFTSGYTDDTMLAHGIRENTVHFIAKPYSPQALGHKVREVLDAGATKELP